MLIKRRRRDDLAVALGIETGRRASSVEIVTTRQMREASEPRDPAVDQKAPQKAPQTRQF